MPPYQPSPFLLYLAQRPDKGNDLPSLNVLSKELGLSVTALREQLEVARALGLVEVRPRVGITRLPYQFSAAVELSLHYAITLDSAYFYVFADLRKHVELAYWDEAVRSLEEEDKQALQDLMQRAWQKLDSQPPQIPHEEHKELHLRIYTKLKNNVFVMGILSGYWSAYQAIGLNVYTDIAYLREVWDYHQRIVDAIISGNYQAGYDALKAHTDLISHRK